MAKNSIFVSHFLKNQFEFWINSKKAWRYSYDEHIEAVIITVGARNTAYEALPGPHRAHFIPKQAKSRQLLKIEFRPKKKNMNKSFTNAFLWLNRSSLPKMIKIGWVELEKTKALEEERRRWQHHSAHFTVFQKITTFEPDRIFKRAKQHRVAYFQQII